MQLHLAAVFGNDMEVGGRYYPSMHAAAQHYMAEVPHVLESYHYFNKPAQLERLRASGRKVFLDSGAFSAWTQGVEINVEQYCRFIQDYADVFTCASVLDVIGSGDGTWNNQTRMERLGVRPLPCFHYGDDVRYCDHYANNYEYITLGGMAKLAPGLRLSWLDKIWEDHLTDGAGRPKCKVHGFALTGFDVMQRYPWFSVDSSSWIQFGNMGYVFDPDYGVIEIGDKKATRHEDQKHFDSMVPIVQQRLADRFAQVGFTVEELRTSYLYRRAFCMWSYTEMNRRLSAKPAVFINDNPGLF